MSKLTPDTERPTQGDGSHLGASDRDWGKIILLTLGGTCVLLACSDLLYHKHAHFAFEELFSFHGVFGFLAYVAIVNSAKLLRLWVKRPEDYYD